MFFKDSWLNEKIKMEMECSLSKEVKGESMLKLNIINVNATWIKRKI